MEGNNASFLSTVEGIVDHGLEESEMKDSNPMILSPSLNEPKPTKAAQMKEAIKPVLTSLGFILYPKNHMVLGLVKLQENPLEIRLPPDLKRRARGWKRRARG